MILYCKLQQKKSYSYEGVVSHCKIQHQVPHPDAPFGLNSKGGGFALQITAQEKISVQGDGCLIRREEWVGNASMTDAPEN